MHAQGWDDQLLHSINRHRNVQLDPAARLVSQSVYPIFGTFLLAEGIHCQRDSISKKQFQAICIGAAANTLISLGLKYSVHRNRPGTTHPDLEVLEFNADPSFPSGKTSAAFFTATMLSLQHPKWYVVGPALLWAGSVGYSRMHLGAHYPSDVLAGACLGAGTAYLSHRMNAWLGRRKSKPKH